MIILLLLLAQLAQTGAGLSGPSAPVSGTITCKQGCSPAIIANQGSAPATISYGANITAGNVGIYVFENGESNVASYFTVTQDPPGESYPLQTGSNAGNSFQYGAIWAVINSAGGYENVQNCFGTACGGGNQYGGAALIELSSSNGSGNPTLDSCNTATGTGLTASVSITPGASNDFYVGYILNPNSATITVTSADTNLGNFQYTNGVATVYNSTGSAMHTLTGTTTGSQPWTAGMCAWKP